MPHIYGRYRVLRDAVNGWEQWRVCVDGDWWQTVDFRTFNREHEACAFAATLAAQEVRA